jgi:lysozyme
MKMTLPSPQLHWPIVWDGVVLIAQSEGCRLRAYKDIVGVWTIGWGETQSVTAGMVWTQQQADEAFCRRLKEFSDNVQSVITNPASPNQLAAFVSLAYNIGVGAFSHSSALRLHNQGKYNEVAAAIQLWNKAGGKVVTGLVKRRVQEAGLYMEGVAAQNLVRDDAPLDEAVEGVPDADENCEGPLIKSTSMQAGAVTAAASGLAIAVGTTQQAVSISSAAGLFSPWLLPGLASVGLAAGGVVMYRAWRRRQEGRQ